MTSTDYRIESNRPLGCRLFALPQAQQHYVGDRALAVALAAKSVTTPSGAEIRVVHVPTGEIVFRKSAGRPDWREEP